MDHIALYRQWRPRTFDEIVEQGSTVMALRQAVISKRISHAYLFSGTRGTGKTTIAQIFSRAINCLEPVNGNPCNSCQICKDILSLANLDVIEMDAASNNSVDNIRNMTDEVIFAPTIAKYKVYIIDEVHMLSTGAFNALLKTLEEPPAHAVFILATTEPHRIPATIISRCQRYEFRRISHGAVVDRLKLISDDKGFEYEETALSLIARISDGALRDAISLLDQTAAVSGNKISNESILSLVGMVTDDFLSDFVSSMIGRDFARIFKLTDDFIMDGKDINRLTADLVEFYRDLLLISTSTDLASILNISQDKLKDMESLSKSVPTDYLLHMIKELSKLSTDLKRSLNPRISFEAAVIRASIEATGEDLQSHSSATPASSGQNKTMRAGRQASSQAVSPASTSQPQPAPHNQPQERQAGGQGAQTVSSASTSQTQPTHHNQPQEKQAGGQGAQITSPTSNNNPASSNNSAFTNNTAPSNRTEESEELSKQEVGKKVLEAIAGTENMILYLYLKVADISLENNILTIIFDKSHFKHFNETSLQKNKSEIERSASKALQRKVKVNVLLGST